MKLEVLNAKGEVQTIAIPDFNEILSAKDLILHPDHVMLIAADELPSGVTKGGILLPDSVANGKSAKYMYCLSAGANVQEFVGKWAVIVPENAIRSAFGIKDKAFYLSRAESVLVWATDENIQW